MSIQTIPFNGSTYGGPGLPMPRRRIDGMQPLGSTWRRPAPTWPGDNGGRAIDDGVYRPGQENGTATMLSHPGAPIAPSQDYSRSLAIMRRQNVSGYGVLRGMGFGRPEADAIEGTLNANGQPLFPGQPMPIPNVEAFKAARGRGQLQPLGATAPATPNPPSLKDWAAAAHALNPMGQMKPDQVEQKIGKAPTTQPAGATAPASPINTLGLDPKTFKIPTTDPKTVRSAATSLTVSPEDAAMMLDTIRRQHPNASQEELQGHFGMLLDHYMKTNENDQRDGRTNLNHLDAKDLFNQYGTRPLDQSATGAPATPLPPLGANAPAGNVNLPMTPNPSGSAAPYMTQANGQKWSFIGSAPTGEQIYANGHQAVHIGSNGRLTGPAQPFEYDNGTGPVSYPSGGIQAPQHNSGIPIAPPPDPAAWAPQPIQPQAPPPAAPPTPTPLPTPPVSNAAPFNGPTAPPPPTMTTDVGRAAAASQPPAMKLPAGAQSNSDGTISMNGAVYRPSQHPETGQWGWMKGR